jgi:hypothetical protein
MEYQVNRFDSADYTIDSVNPPDRLILDRKYGAPSIQSSAYRIFASLQPRDRGGGVAPSMPRQLPLDLILLAA